ncbi:MAG: alpha/beta hydrolase [Planctomycetia bacterium]|nr:alpha/beta hydrolase [Planctomycetia bacterium]
MQPHRLLLAVCYLSWSLPVFAQPAKPEPKRVPEKLPERVVFQPDLVFAAYGQRELKLDLFAPKDGAGPHPALVLIHGGGWQSGNKTELRPLAQQLAARGFVCICIEHRLSGEAKFPAAIQDCKAAVRWLRANAEKHRIDKNRIGGVGGSTGGHLVNLLATSAGVDKFEGDGGHARHSSAVQSIVNFAGTMDMTMPHFIERTRKDRNDPAVKFLGATYDENPKLYTEASPITYIGKQTPPMLHIDGEHDRPAFRTERSRKMLKDLGIKTDLIVVKDGPHAFWLFEPYFTPLVEDVAKWFGETLKPAK